MTWGIAEKYGGMTSAMLYRCKQFCDFDFGASLTILTLDPSIEVSKAEKHIQSRWDIPDSIKIRNIWNDLRFMSDQELQKLSGDIGSEYLPAVLYENYTFKKRFQHEFRDANNRVFRQEYFRLNGSLLVLDDRSLDSKKTVLYDSNGLPLKTWESIDGLYLAWLKYVMVNRFSILINEDAALGRILYRLNVHNIKTVQVVHGSHLREPEQAPYGEFTVNRANTLYNIESFDLVSILTAWHMQDLLSLGIDASNLCVMPNATKPVKLNQLHTRDIKAGAIISQLEPRKQISHSLKAISKINNSITLTVYGEGVEYDKLNTISNELGINAQVDFKGYVPHASTELTDYSFLLLTSKSEGQPLVLLEAMARGCIPISYDMRYGPRDTIRHGVDGFLVPPDDIDALTETIKSFLKLPEQKIAAMRLAAIKRAEDFYPKNNIKRWDEVLTNVVNTPARTEVKYTKGCKVIAEDVKIDNGQCCIVGRLVGEEVDLKLDHSFIVTTRGRSSFLKLMPDFKFISKKEGKFEAVFSLTSIPLADIAFLDFFMQPVGAAWVEKVRVSYALLEDKIIVPEGKVYKTIYGNLSFDFRLSN